MKKPMIYILAMTAAFSVFMSGCGEMKNDREPASPTHSPVASVLPDEMMPDPEDGVVKDDDGIIEDKDSGAAGEQKPGDSMREDSIWPDDGAGNKNGSLPGTSGAAQENG